MARRVVYMVHGIWSRGPWFEITRRTLEPLFDCRSVHYPQFLIAGPLGLLSPFRRSRAFQNVRRQLGTVVADPAPNVIAHSLGAFLVSRFIERSETARFTRIVMVGSVSRREFPWHHHRAKFIEVRNEVGSRDWIVRIARLMPGLGTAGFHGFAGDQSIIHDVEGASGPCDHCSCPRAPVHNYSLGSYDHNEFGIEQQHVLKLWLPFLLGFQPHDFEEFNRLCFKVAALKANQDIRLTTHRDRLADRSWSWLEVEGRNGTLREYVRRTTAEWDGATDAGASGGHTRTIEDIIDAMCTMITAARTELTRPLEDRDAAIAARLDPCVALSAALATPAGPR